MVDKVAWDFADMLLCSLHLHPQLELKLRLQNLGLLAEHLMVVPELELVLRVHLCLLMAEVSFLLELLFELVRAQV